MGMAFTMAGAIPDLTNADASTYKANLGKTVFIQGELQNGKEGCSVRQSTEKVAFYVVSDASPGGFSIPRHGRT